MASKRKTKKIKPQVGDGKLLSTRKTKKIKPQVDEDKLLSNERTFSDVFCRWVNPVVGLVLVALLLSVGLIWTINYNAYGKSVSMSGYDFVETNSLNKSQMINRSEILANQDKTNTGEYASISMVSIERSYRTAQSKGSMIVSMVAIFMIIGLSMASFTFDYLSLFDFYHLKFKTIDIIIKSALVAASIMLLISIPCYLAALPTAVSGHYSIGATVYILPIICALFVANIVVYLVLNKKAIKQMEI